MAFGGAVLCHGANKEPGHSRLVLLHEHQRHRFVLLHKVADGCAYSPAAIRIGVQYGHCDFGTSLRCLWDEDVVEEILRGFHLHSTAVPFQASQQGFLSDETVTVYEHSLECFCS